MLLTNDSQLAMMMIVWLCSFARCRTIQTTHD